MDKTVVELFAGVGGFRVGLNDVTLNKNGEVYESNRYKFVWANQWEPSSNIQHAYDCYIKRFGNSASHVNEDISTVNKKDIPDHTLLVGGFPCQDYSVARSLSKEKGIEGKKGVLWWEIYKTLEAKKPPFVLLENVDRLLKSPSKQRGRDFGIMLRTLNDLGYGVEWRVINAAEYGFAQRRRRVFIFAFKNNTEYFKSVYRLEANVFLTDRSMFAKSLPVVSIGKTETLDISKNKFSDLVKVSDDLAFKFDNSGFAINHTIITAKATPAVETPITLGDIIETTKVDDHFYLSDEKLAKFNNLRGSKKIERTNKETGISYFYSEGSMSPHDLLTLPARTMLTSEGSVNRSTHIIEDPHNHHKMRLITPEEAERLNGFPTGWTNTGMPEKRRYFMMGNALVCDVVNRLSKQLDIIFENEK
jgi:DNA (cytosine-5)-methyltransferase 1